MRTTAENLPGVRPIKGRAATLNDIAQALGLTQATVSCALNGKGRVAPQTRKAVLETAQRLDFRPNQHAQRLNKGRAQDTVGLFAWSLDLGVATRKLQLIQNLLVQRGFNAPIHICGQSLRGGGAASQVEAMSSLCAQSPLAIICNTSFLHPKIGRELERFQAQGGIVICYDLPMDIQCDQVLFDREHNVYLAARHLLELGHRRIAFYGGWDEPGAQRKAGFERALAEFRVTPQPEWSVWNRAGEEDMASGGVHEENGVQLAELFMALKPRPTAIYIADDVVAAAFIVRLQRHSVLVPDDVSVVGEDDLPLAAYISAVPLTTVSQPVKAIANTVVQLLTERLDDAHNGALRQVVVRGELVQRLSTSSPVANPSAF